MYVWVIDLCNVVVRSIHKQILSEEDKLLIDFWIDIPSLYTMYYTYQP